MFGIRETLMIELKIFFMKVLIIGQYSFFSLLLFVFPVENKEYYNHPKSNQVCKIIVISPYACINEIEFTEKGDGVLKTGLTNGNITDENVHLDTIYSVDSFHILKGRQVKKINMQVLSLLKRDSLKGYPKNDAFRFRVFVNNTSKVDVYGGVREVNRILELLVDYLPLSNDKCKFFELFKKSIHRSD